MPARVVLVESPQRRCDLLPGGCFGRPEGAREGLAGGDGPAHPLERDAVAEPLVDAAVRARRSGSASCSSGESPSSSSGASSGATKGSRPARTGDGGRPRPEGRGESRSTRSALPSSWRRRRPGLRWPAGQGRGGRARGRSRAPRRPATPAGSRSRPARRRWLRRRRPRPTPGHRRAAPRNGRARPRGRPPPEPLGVSGASACGSSRSVRPSSSGGGGRSSAVVAGRRPRPRPAAP